MSGMNHPPVDLGIRRDISFERQLAEEAFEILQTQSKEVEREIGGYALSLRQSDMADLTAEDHTDLAFRVKSVPSLLMGANETSVKNPGRLAHSFYVMDIQQGTVSDEIEDATEENYIWKSYLKIIVNTHNHDDVVVLNGQNYKKKLSGEDVNTALYIMTLIRQELRGRIFEEELADTSENQSFGMKYVQRSKRKGGAVRKFAEFASDDFMDVSSCDECYTSNQPCKHNKFTLQ